MGHKYPDYAVIHCDDGKEHYFKYTSELLWMG